MAKIIREIKFWRDGSGVSHHLGIQLDTETDLGIVLDPKRSLEQIAAAVKVTDNLLLEYVKANAVNFGIQIGPTTPPTSGEEWIPKF